MAGRGNRRGPAQHFWTVAGQVDKEGAPIRFSSAEEARASASEKGGILGTGLGAGVGPLATGSKMTAWRAENYDNGDIVVSQQDPKTNDWNEVDVQRNDKLADDFRADQGKSQTPNAARIEAANATVAEENARKATNPEMIRRTGPTPGTNAAVDDPRSQTTSTVTKSQDESDRAWSTEQRQAQAAILAAAQQQEQQAITAARLLVEQGQLTATQARDKVNAEMEKIRNQLTAQANEITQRGQDVQARGQDIQAGTTTRGQDLTHEEALAQNSTSLAIASMPYLQNPSQMAAINDLMHNRPAGEITPMKAPYDPLTFPAQAALNARGAGPSPFTLPGGPARVAPAGPFQLPPPG